MEDFLDAKCTAACWNVGPRPAVTASTSGANIAYWSLLKGKSGPPTEVGRFVRTPQTPYAYAPESRFSALYVLVRSSANRGYLIAFCAY